MLEFKSVRHGDSISGRVLQIEGSNLESEKGSVNKNCLHLKELSQRT